MKRKTKSEKEVSKYDYDKDEIKALANLIVCDLNAVFLQNHFTWVCILW